MVLLWSGSLIIAAQFWDDLCNSVTVDLDLKQLAIIARTIVRNLNRLHSQFQLIILHSPSACFSKSICAASDAKVRSSNGTSKGSVTTTKSVQDALFSSSADVMTLEYDRDMRSKTRQLETMKHLVNFLGLAEGTVNINKAHQSLGMVKQAQVATCGETTGEATGKKR